MPCWLGCNNPECSHQPFSTFWKLILDYLGTVRLVIDYNNLLRLFQGRSTSTVTAIKIFQTTHIEIHQGSGQRLGAMNMHGGTNSDSS